MMYKKKEFINIDVVSKKWCIPKLSLNRGFYYLFLIFYQGKVQKHQAFEAEVAANEDRVTTTIKVGRGTK